FGSWTVLWFIDIRRSYKYWLCRCACGIEKAVRGSKLYRGESTNCGCIREANRLKVITKHGYYHTKVHKTWSSMRDRCLNPNHPQDHRYGGRGITISERWNSFEAFLADMGEPPSPKYSIDRIDNNKGYSPDNCRWATTKTQQRNLRSNRIIQFNNESRTLIEWAEITGIPYGTLQGRLNKYHWPVS